MSAHHPPKKAKVRGQVFAIGGGATFLFDYWCSHIYAMRAQLKAHTHTNPLQDKTLTRKCYIIVKVNFSFVRRGRNLYGGYTEEIKNRTAQGALILRNANPISYRWAYWSTNIVYPYLLK